MTYPFKTDAPKRGRKSKGNNLMLGVPAPAAQDWAAGGLADFINEASRLGVDAYSLVRSTDCTADPPDIMGAETAKSRLRIFGPVAPGGGMVDPETGEPIEGEEDPNADPEDGDAGETPAPGAGETPALRRKKAGAEADARMLAQAMGAEPAVAPAPDTGEAPVPPGDDEAETDENGFPKPKPFSGNPRGEGADKPSNQSELAIWLQKVFDNCKGMVDFLRHTPWAYIYGVYFWQIRWVWEEGVGLVPDFRWGERLPTWAGGQCMLHPNHTDIIIRHIWGFDENRPPEMLAEDHTWVMMKPGGTGNPRGSGWLMLRYFRNAQRFQTCDANREVFGQQMTLPMWIFKWISQYLPVGKQAEKWDELEAAMTMDEAMELLMIGDNKTIADLLVYPTDGVKFLDDQETRLKSRCMIALMHTALLADTRSSGPTGSSKEARTTANSAVIAHLDWVAQLINNYVIPYIIRENERVAPGSVPDLRPGEVMPRAQFVMPGEMEGDTNPTQDSAADRVPEFMRPMPTGAAKNEKGNEESNKAKA